jgi:hypothetical protein
MPGGHCVARAEAEQGVCGHLFVAAGALERYRAQRCTGPGPGIRHPTAPRAASAPTSAGPVTGRNEADMAEETQHDAVIGNCRGRPVVGQVM